MNYRLIIKFKIFFLLLIPIMMLSCNDKEAQCKDGSFLHSSGNCVDPCKNIGCGDGECIAVSANEYKCSEPTCISPKTLDKLSNRCVDLCSELDCGAGECKIISASKAECIPPVCDENFYPDDNNNCVNPCIDVNCGAEAICQTDNAYSFECVAGCDNSLGYYEKDGKCVAPCKDVDCGLGEVSCNYEPSTGSRSCQCDSDHILLNDRCRLPFKKIQWEASAFTPIEPEGFKDHKDKYDAIPHHNGYDVIFKKSDTQYIEGNFEYGKFRKNLENEEVSIFVYSYTDENQNWKPLADVIVYDNDAGEYSDSDNPCKDFLDGSDKGGTFCYVLPEGQKLPIGLHLIKLVVRGDGSETNMFMRVKPDNEELKMVVFDMDGTLTTSNSEISWAYARELWDGDSADMAMYPSADKVATYYYQRGYEILYLTARPYWLSEKSYNWLVLRNFPFGYMHTYEGTMPDGNLDAETFKKRYLKSLTDKGIKFEYTYGNALTDIAAYKSLGTPCNKIFIIGEHAGKDCSVAIPSYPQHLEDLPR